MSLALLLEERQGNILSLRARSEVRGRGLEYDQHEHKHVRIGATTLTIVVKYGAPVHALDEDG